MKRKIKQYEFRERFISLWNRLLYIQAKSKVSKLVGIPLFWEKDKRLIEHEIESLLCKDLLCPGFSIHTVAAELISDCSVRPINEAYHDLYTAVGLDDEIKNRIIELWSQHHESFRAEALNAVDSLAEYIAKRLKVPLVETLDPSVAITRAKFIQRAERLLDLAHFAYAKERLKIIDPSIIFTFITEVRYHLGRLEVLFGTPQKNPFDRAAAFLQAFEKCNGDYHLVYSARCEMSDVFVIQDWDVGFEFRYGDLRCDGGFETKDFVTDMLREYSPVIYDKIHFKPIVLLKILVTGPFKLLATFADGTERLADVREFPFEGIFAQIKEDQTLFETLHVSSGDPTWGDDLYLCADFLYRHSKLVRRVLN